MYLWCMLMVLIMVLVAAMFPKLYCSEPHFLGAGSLFGISEAKIVCYFIFFGINFDSTST
jgi:hypothetical protein